MQTATQKIMPFDKVGDRVRAKAKHKRNAVD